MPPHRGETFLEACPTFAPGNAGHFELLRYVPESETDQCATVRQVIEGGEASCKDHWVLERQENDARSETDRARSRSNPHEGFDGIDTCVYSSINVSRPIGWAQQAVDRPQSMQVGGLRVFEPSRRLTAVKRSVRWWARRR